METKRPLAPSFVNKLDKWLLLNMPEIWTARTHLVLYYGLLFFIVLAGLSFIVPDDPRIASDAHKWVGFVSLLSFIGLVVWCIYVLRFNVFKRFGTTGYTNRLITFLLYLVSIGFFVLMPYVEPYIETVRANHAFKEKELVDDINYLNLNISRLEYDSMNHHWRTDTTKLVAGEEDDPLSDVSIASPPIATTDSVTEYSPHTSNIRYINKNQLQYEMHTSDSFHKLNDSMYVFLTSPDYTLLTPYFRHTPKGIHTSYDIYKLLHSSSAPNKKILGKQVDAIINKYALSYTENEIYYTISQVNDRIRYRYNLRQVENAIENIVRRKDRWNEDDLPIYLRIHLYLTICLTLLLFAFRHSTPKSFFFGLLTAVVLSIFTSLVLAFSSGTKGGFFIWLIFYFICFFLISLTALKSSRRSTITGIAINLFFWLLPFIPLCAVAAYYESMRYSSAYYKHLSAMETHLHYAEFAGIALLLVAVASYLHLVYRKWYAAPEQ